MEDGEQPATVEERGVFAAMADAGCGQGKSCVSLQELPEDVLAVNIFARLPVSDLLSIRPTCKLWNMLVLSDPRIPDGSALDACFLLLMEQREPQWSSQDPPEKMTEWWTKNEMLVAVHRPVHNEWFPTVRPWKGLPDQFRPDSGGDGHSNCRVRFKLVDVEGPFVLYKIFESVGDQTEFRDPGGWCVLNPVTQGTWTVPPPNPDVGDVNYYTRRKAKLVQTSDASGKLRWKLVMLTIVPSQGTGPLQEQQGFIYIHVCDRFSWKLVHTAEMRDHRAWLGMRPWTVGKVFLHGRFVIFVLRADFKVHYGQRLWAFDVVEERGRHIDVSEIVSPYMHFVSCFGYVVAVTSGNEDKSILNFYKHSSLGSLPSKVEGCWSKVGTFRIRPDRRLFLSCTAVNHCVYVASFLGVEVIYNVLDDTMNLVPDHPEPRETEPFYSITERMCFRPSKVAEFMSSK